MDRRALLLPIGLVVAVMLFAAAAPQGSPFWRLSGNAGTDASIDFLGTTDAQDLVVKTNGTEALRVTSGGHVGIGTADPGVFGLPGPLFSLDIRNPNPFSSDTVVAISSAAGQATLDLHSLNEEAILTFGNGAQSASSAIALDRTTESLHFCVADTGNCQLATETRMTLHPSGNIGVGTKIPRSALQVVGYTQLDLTTGAPPALDCDEATERGRMIVDSAAGVLYVCVDGGWLAK